MGVLEASLPLRPWGFPYSMLLLCAGGRIFRTNVALVSVGAGTINQPLTRWLFNMAARSAFYRSYRNTGSRDAMRQRGLDTTRDPVYPDLAFALPAPAHDPGDPQIVCVGVMEYHGSNDDREQADEIRSSYVDGMKRFVRWLVDHDRKVRLLIGDTNGSDGRGGGRDSSRFAGVPARSRPVLGGGSTGYFFCRRPARDAACGQRGRNSLPQHPGRAQARQAHHRNKLLAETRRPDGGYGRARILPAGQPVRLRPAHSRGSRNWRAVRRSSVK